MACKAVPKKIGIQWLAIWNSHLELQLNNYQSSGIWYQEFLLETNTSRNNPIRPIFKLLKGGQKLVECLPIIIKKISKFGIAEFYISPATCQKFDIND